MERGVLGELIADLAAEFDSLRVLITSGTDLVRPTPAVGWDIRSSVSHLIGCDLLAKEAIAAPDEFQRARPATDDGLAELLESHIAARRDLPAKDLRQEWDEAFAALLRAFASSCRDENVPWFGPPMSPATLATARLMEYWAHGQDVADALKIVRQPTDRIRHVCHLGFVTFEFSFVNRGLPVPPSPPRVELRLPSGLPWVRGPEDGRALVTGDALDFALVVTQRRHRSDTSLTCRGEVAEQWLAIAQCFAGPPGPGRAPSEVPY
ncbi:TIGR03084 family metal-binding protein [Streptomyces luomodiensis]|uniref:TIGR03084 family metal-binding protein n=1 Tax=Streptomyces luomodiensis TaxID=3026192 RepID=A0ABY9VF04_9ACTN|nr:TIGR03084 family metal-binding protein [Streptomyces sp. SCA4-21]WNF01291.1 TIGR03084 family metal-binding protein [Streptomyces sp. SCA4-21]